MSEAKAQTHANHARIDPMYHYFTFGVLGINVLVRIWRAASGFSVASAWEVLVAAALVVMCWKVRTYPLTAQDRVIRLEERLRLERVLPDPLRARIPELSARQLIALRFAPDAELPSLVERALGGAPPKDLKQAVQNWRADHLRV